MTSPPSARAARGTPLADDAALLSDELRAVRAPLARAILAHALALGIAADLLLRDGFTGVGYPIWVLVLAMSALSLVWRDGRRLPGEVAGWLATAVLFGAGLAWRDAEQLQVLDFLATLLALGMAGIALADARAALAAARLRDTLWAAAAVIRSTAFGVVPLALRDVALPGNREELRGRFRPAVRAALIALPVMLLFGALLRGADPVFASMVSLPALDVESLVTHVLVTGFFAWIVAGWARGALMADAARPRAPEQWPVGLGLLDVTAVLGTLDALFALYVVTQLGWFFGGERFLHERTGLTVAEYAREGFFQMVWVAVLVVPVLLGTRAMLRPGRALARRHTALALPLLGLLGVMMVSSALRLRLYVHYYGLTTDRLYALVFMGWLTVVLVWLTFTVLRGAGRSFVAGATVSGLATLAALNVAVPDAIVARANIARATRATDGAAGLDVTHLARLSGEAAPLALAAVFAPSTGAPGSPERVMSDRTRCEAAGWLLARRRLSAWDGQREEQSTAWRRWNFGEASARRLTRTHGAALLEVQHTTCPRLRAKSR